LLIIFYINMLLKNCGLCWGEKKCVHGFGGDLGIDGRII
jgi:hypothetical protein